MHSTSSTPASQCLFALEACNILRPRKLAGFSFQRLEKRHDILPSFAFHGMQNATGLQIHEDAHIGMTFADTELVDTEVLEFSQWGSLTAAVQMLLVHIVDQIPAHAEDFGCPLDGHPMKQVDSELGKAFCLSLLFFDKRQFGPSQGSALLPPKAPYQQTQKSRSPANRHHAERPGFGTFLPDGPPTSTHRAVLDSKSHLGLEDRPSLFVYRLNVLDSFQSKGMIEQGGGHGRYPFFDLVTKESTSCAASSSIKRTQ